MEPEVPICMMENISIGNKSSNHSSQEMELTLSPEDKPTNGETNNHIHEKELHSANNLVDKITLCGTFNNGSRFFKGCKWSPDEMGNRILTCDADNKLTIFHTFLNKIDYTTSQISGDKLELCNVGNIYDFDWYPAVSPAQYYAVIASSLGPLHIYDVSSSKSIASYQMYNTNDEVVHAHSLASSSDGSVIIGGTANYLFLFDVNRPGRTYKRIMTRPHFRRGIISTIAVNPQRHSMFAVGSYNNRIGIYDDTDLLCLLFGHVKGITHMRFSPDGLLLYSGTRGNSDIICWDLRNPGTALYKLERVVKTQQRIYFDITSNGRYIISGSTNGDTYIWDSLSPPDGNTLFPVHKFKSHQDCTNGVGLHHQLPFLATASGQYHYPELVYALEGSDDETLDPSCLSVENSLKLWHIDF